MQERPGVDANAKRDRWGHEFMLRPVRTGEPRVGIDAMQDGQLRPEVETEARRDRGGQKLMLWPGGAGGVGS